MIIPGIVAAGLRTTMNYVALPLTYDEEDAAGAMTWVRQGAGPHVTPGGCEGDGYEARYKSTTIPAWMSASTSPIEIQASVKIFHQRHRSTGAGETILYLGPDSAGVSPNPKLALRVLQEPQDVRYSFLGLQAYTGALQTLPLARPQWRFEFRFPVLTANSEKARPQALLFLDADTAVVTAHYNDTESRAYKVAIDTGEVLSSFSFGSHLHIAAFAKTSAGAVWCLDYAGASALEIDLDASFTAGTVEVTKTVSLANFVGPSGLEFATVSGTEYALLGEYATTGTPYLYVYPLSAWTDGATPTVAGRYKRFSIGQRNQGQTIKDGHLYVAKNRHAQTSVLYGDIERYDNIASRITSSADGATLTFDRLHSAPSRFPEDLKFHPTTGHLWTMTEGWDDVVDHDGWLSAWSSPLDGSEVENTVNAYYDGAGSVIVKMQGKVFDTKSWTPSQGVAAVTVGGPPSQAAGLRNGYFAGYVRDIVLQEGQMTATQYAAAVSGAHEPNALTAYTLTLTNPGAESGTTGWTNEVGGLGTRSASPAPFEGGAYFFAGANAQTIARQRLDLLTLTGLSGGDVDAGGIWAKIRWAQSGWRGDPNPADDPGSMGLRMLNASQTQISLTYSGIEAAPHCLGTSPNDTWFWYRRAIGVDIPTGARYLDAVYRSDRAAGTNNDFYCDAIAVTVYRR